MQELRFAHTLRLIRILVFLPRLVALNDALLERFKFVFEFCAVDLRALGLIMQLNLRSYLTVCQWVLFRWRCALRVRLLNNRIIKFDIAWRSLLGLPFWVVLARVGSLVPLPDFHVLKFI